jgi:hypothetical protein
MPDKEYVCAYNKCLHNGQKVKSSESVVINGKHYHWDCAETKQNIKRCVDEYMDCVEDKTVFPIVMKIINDLVLKNKVPTEFVLKKIESSKRYYSSKPPHVLYGIRKMFWEKEFRA